jgi:hypothetical protein
MPHLPVLRRLLVVLAVACCVLAVAAPGASGAFRTYISGYLTKTFSQPGCYYASSEACTGFNYWHCNLVQTGQTDAAGDVHSCGL